MKKMKNREPIGLLEFGSNSLKFYRVEHAGGECKIETIKRPWQIAYDFFKRGTIRDRSLHQMLGLLQEISAHAPDIPLRRMLCVATGVFRELPVIDDIGLLIKRKLGVRLRVISGEDEARLMARGVTTKEASPVLVCDLGGATTEWALITKGELEDCGSLPLGAIRHYCLFRQLEQHPESYLQKHRDHCDESLADLNVPSRTRLLATGGTAKAMARCVDEDIVEVSRLSALIERVQKEGAPEFLKPQRRQVLLPGLVILERTAIRCGADAIEYGRSGVRDGMAARLVQLTERRQLDNIHVTLLLNSRATR